MSAEFPVLYRVDGGIARIALNRPEKRNALNRELIATLKGTLRESARDESIRVVVLGGKGKDFCSGMDLNMLLESAGAGMLSNREEAHEFAEVVLAMRHHPRPIVAAVRGRALAGGCGLATAADIILAAESAQFGYPEVNIGFVPAIVTALLRRSVSEKRAFELITSGESISAATAFDFGLVNRVFADETFDVDVETYAVRLAAKPPSSVMLSKRLLYLTDGMGFEASIEAGGEVNAIARLTEDFKRGVEKVLKKS